MILDHQPFWLNFQPTITIIQSQNLQHHLHFSNNATTFRPIVKFLHFHCTYASHGSTTRLISSIKPLVHLYEPKYPSLDIFTLHLLLTFTGS